MSNQPSSRTRRLQVERLESKLVLSASSAGMGTEDLSDDFYSQVSGAWFAEVAPSKELALDPQGAEAWIVRLSPAATAEAGNALGAVGVLSDLPLTVVRGLGKSGQLLVQAPAGVDLAADLARDARIAWAAPDAEVAGQLTPQDELYPQQEPALDQIGASDAWDNTTGSPTTVVGVIDSGITADHPDLYQNVWLNQGEIPASLRQQLVDTDGDQLITFYDLNAPANAGLVAESPDDGAANNYIDAYDILADPAWADGVDTDGNGFVDDFFGWNFRSAADEPFAPNDPSDAIGHGTQVAGIIGATASADPGGVGVAGINWQTSIMSLKFLDEQLQGAVSDAVRAVNYATMMRLDFGVNLVATNNSWGQSGGFNSALFDAIQASGDAGILFVAAAGNGNALGLGIDNDQSPFYPASYDAPNVVSVAATGGNGDLAAFSNFGASSVDLAAPGVGVLSTVLAGAYATANGTSMAAPHVAGAAALLLSQPGLQGASLEEIKTALLSEVETDGDLAGRVATSGRLNIDSAFDHDGFAPQAELVSDPDVVITAAGPASHTVTIRYTDVAGIDTTSLGQDDLVVTRLWGPVETLVPSSFEIVDEQLLGPSPNQVDVIYTFDPLPRDPSDVNTSGEWDPLDFGEYRVALAAGRVVNENQVAAAATTLGSFDVQTPADGVFFVNSLDDGTAPGAVTLRGAIQAIQQSPTATGVIVLGPGVHELSLVGAGENAAATGDLDITGDITIYGDQASASVVDANGIDRVFDVQPGGRLELVRVGVTGGGATDRGGGVRSAGTLVLDSVEVTGNRVTTTDETDPATGAGVALVGGDASIVDTTIRNNVAGVLNNDYGGSLSSYGGGLSVGDAAAAVSRSTIADNSATTAGGVFSYAENDAPQNVLTLTNVTVSGNRAELFGGAGLLLGNDASLDHVTVANNLAGSGDVGLATYDDAINPTGFTVNLANSIIVGPSSAADLQGYANGDWQNNSFATSPGVNPEITSGGYNLFSSVDDALFTSGGPVLTATDTETTADYDDILSPLADYGGPTPTHALPPGSPALDAANPASVVVEDQRGVARAFDADVDGAAVADAGAYEADSATVTGVVFLDLDGEGRRDGNELGIAGRRVFADLDLDGVYDAGEPFTFTVDDDPTTVAESELGRFELAGLAPGNTTLVVESPADWTAIQQAALGVSFRADGELAGSLPVAAEAVASVLDVDDEGRFVAYVTPAAGIDPGDTNGVSDVFVYDRLTGATEWISQSAAGVPAASGGIEVAISGDGAVVAFTSDAALTASAGPGSNLYLYDRGLGQITHTVVGGGAGDLGSLDVNADGMVVAFVSGADLSTGVADTNNADDVFVFDRSANPAGVVELISVSLTGVAADFFSRRPSLSSDGNRVAFDSWADDISATDGFNIDVFVRDRAAGVTTLVSTGNGGGAANGDSTAPSISGDGLWVGYESTATNLTNTPHFFDLPLIYLSPVGGGPGQTVLVTKDPVLGRALADSNGAAEVSGDGRFLLYESTSTQLVPQAGVTSGGLFLYDRVADENRVVLAPDDFALSGVYAKLSGDGATVVLATPEQLAEEDGNVEGDAYARTNPFLLSQPSDFNATLIAGQLVAGVEFGQLPNPGSISGTYFDDLDGDGVQDAGEPGLAGRTVFLDADGDGGLDGVTGLFPGDELRTTTDADGAYQFAGLPANADYSVVAVVPEDEALVLPTQEQGGAWQVFLAAAEAATNRNFATQPAAVGGESNNATIRGVVFADTNGNGLQDAGEPGLPGKTVYLDLNNNGLQDAGVEEQFSVTEATTDATGAFTLSSLGSVGGSVRILNAGPGEITNPRGNAFAAAGVYETALDRTEPLDIYNTELVDLTGDNLPEIVVAKRETNRLTVLVNDGAGGYGGPITIDLGVSLGASSGSPAGAIAVAHGDFNGAGSNDLAVISYYTSDVTILLDYNAATGAFASTTNVTSSLGSSSGRFPFEIVTIDADGDGDLDLATADAGTGTVSLLLNDGNGVFSANPFTQVFSSVLPGAAQQEPAGLAVGDFNGDEHQDLAVANFVSVAGGGIAGGSVAVLLGDGDGGFAAAFSYDSAQELFGSGPTSIVAGAFVGGDETLDLAVSHFASNTVSILRGNGDGSFTPLAPLSVPEGPRDLTAADIDGDDDLDLIVSGATGSVGTAAQPAAEQAVAILRNTASRGGDGLDPAEVPGVADLTFGDRFFSHAVGDVDGNGTLDLVVADGGTSRTYVASSSLINGGYQVSLAGTETIEDLNFAMIAALPGDYNGNGVVDAGDYTHWRDHFGQTTAAALAADGNGDGRVDAIDYTIWRDQFQAATAATAATAVASPAAPARSRAPSSAAAPQPQTAAAESAASGSAPAMAFDQAFAAFAPSPIDPAPPAPPTRRVGPAQPALPGRDRDRLPLFFDVFAEPPSAGGSAPNTRVGFSPEAELSDEAFFRAWSWWDDVAGAALGKLRTPRRS